MVNRTCTRLPPVESLDINTAMASLRADPRCIVVWASVERGVLVGGGPYIPNMRFGAVLDAYRPLPRNGTPEPSRARLPSRGASPVLAFIVLQCGWGHT